MKSNNVAKALGRSDNPLLQFCYRELKRLNLSPSPPVLLAMWAAHNRGRGVGVRDLVEALKKGANK